MTGNNRSIREEKALGLIDDTIRTFRFSPAFAENLKILFQYAGEIWRRDANAEAKQVNTKISILKDKKDRLYDLFAEKQIDRQLWREKIEKLNEEISSLENVRRSCEMNHDQLISRACDLIDELRDRPAAFLAATDPVQKAQELAVLAQHVEMGDSTARLKWKQPFSFLMRPALLDLRKNYDLPGPPENRQGPQIQTLDGDFGAACEPKSPKTQKSRPRSRITANPESGSSEMFCSARGLEQFHNLPSIISDTLLEIRLHYAAIDAKEA